MLNALHSGGQGKCAYNFNVFIYLQFKFRNLRVKNLSTIYLP
jgi:hypothetical protein